MIRIVRLWLVWLVMASYIVGGELALPMRKYTLGANTLPKKRLLRSGVRVIIVSINSTATERKGNSIAFTHAVESMLINVNVSRSPVSCFNSLPHPVYSYCTYMYSLGIMRPKRQVSHVAPIPRSAIRVFYTTLCTLALPLPQLLELSQTSRTIRCRISKANSVRCNRR